MEDLKFHILSEALYFIRLCSGQKKVTCSCVGLFMAEKRLELETYANWRASEASETLFSHVYGNSRYIYVYIRTSVSNTHVRVSVLRIKLKS